MYRPLNIRPLNSLFVAALCAAALLAGSTASSQELQVGEKQLPSDKEVLSMLGKPLADWAKTGQQIA